MPLAPRSPRVSAVELGWPCTMACPALEPPGTGWCSACHPVSEVTAEGTLPDCLAGQASSGPFSETPIKMLQQGFDVRGPKATKLNGRKAHALMGEGA